MEKKERSIWFPAKEYGFGWGAPVTWQGWVVLILYLVLSLVASLALVTSPGWLILTMSLLTALLILICWKKGEKPKWRWGKK